MVEKKYALLSVSDKKGIEIFARGLADLGFEILYTGGTASALTESGLSITKVSDYTGNPEILDGRVKTLHPRIHGGILARDTDEHRNDLNRIEGQFIDLVAVNLYPFERTAAVPSVALSDLVEKIDIGGPCLVRAAAKNFERVAVVCDPQDYENVLWHLSKDGEIPKRVRFALALKAFAHTAAYDTAISSTLPEFDFETGKRGGGM